MVLFDDKLCIEVCVGHIAFQPVPFGILGNPALIDADVDLVLNDQEPVVSALVDVPFRDFSRSISIPQTLNSLFAVVCVLGGSGL